MNHRTGREPWRVAAGLLAAVRRDVLAIVGFSAFLAVMNFMFWGGAFGAADLHPYESAQIFAWYSAPSAAVMGAALVALAAAHARGRGKLGRWRWPLELASFAGLAGAVALVAGLLSMAQPPLWALGLAAVVSALGLACGFAAWECAFLAMGPGRAATVVGCACLVFPPIVIALRPLAALPAYACVVGLVGLATLALRGPRLVENPAAADAWPVDPAPMRSVPVADVPAGGIFVAAGLRAVVASYGTEVAGFAALGFVAGFTRTTSLGGGADTLAVTVGSLACMVLVGVLVLARWYGRGRVFAPAALYRLAFPAAATGFLLFAVARLGFSAAFVWFADFFFEFMLVVVALDAVARAKEGPFDGFAAYCLSTGTAFVLLALATVVGWVAHEALADAAAVYTTAVIVCVYALSMPLLLQLRRRAQREGGEAQEGPGVIPATAQGAEALLRKSRSRRIDALVDAHALTPRERQILELTLDGMDSPTVAERLGLSDNTVRTHKKGLYRKLGVHSKQELAALVQSVDKTAGTSVN